MRVLDPGHRYALPSLDGYNPQILTFVKRQGDGYPGNVGAYPGTTSQECLRVLIDRAEYVNNQIPCMETEAAIGLMRSALVLLEVRAARRHGRHLDFSTIREFEDLPTCPKCNHVGCEGMCHEEPTTRR